MISWALFYQIVCLSLLGTIELVIIIRAFRTPTLQTFREMHEVVCEKAAHGDAPR